MAAVTRALLRERGIDYFVAALGAEGLEMEPHCSCGEAVDEEYFCEACNRTTRPTFVACLSGAALSEVERLVRGNPHFRNFGCSMLDE